MADEANRPVLRVVRGKPDEAELAALTAVVASLRAVPEPQDSAVAAVALGGPGGARARVAAARGGRMARLGSATLTAC